MDNANPLASLSPEQLAKLLQGSVLEEKGSLLDQELAQLLGEDFTAQQHSTALGAGLEGLGKAIGNTGNAFLVSALRKRRDANVGDKSQLVGSFGELLRQPPEGEAPAPAPQAPAAAPAAAPVNRMRLPMVDLSTAAAREDFAQNGYGAPPPRAAAPRPTLRQLLAGQDSASPFGF